MQRLLPLLALAFRLRASDALLDSIVRPVLAIALVAQEYLLRRTTLGAIK